MKTLLVAALALLPLAVSADHLDVIQFELKDGCTIEEYLAIKDDFNAQWGQEYSYRAEVLVPVQSHDLKSFYWVGRSPDAASFGAAWDAWTSQSADSSSVAAKLVARFSRCSDETSRRSYQIF